MAQHGYVTRVSLYPHDRHASFFRIDVGSPEATKQMALERPGEEEPKKTDGDSENAASNVPPPPPDCGWHAWLQVIMAHLMYANTLGYILSYGVFQQVLIDDYHISRANVSWVGSIQICLLFFVGTFAGWAFDAGHFRVMYPLGILLQTGGIFATSACTEFWHFVLAEGVCTGIGAGLQFTPVMALVGSYFSTKKLFAMAITSCGSATGGVLYPLIVKELLLRVGFGWTLRTVAFIQLALSLLSLGFLRQRKSIGRKSRSIVDWTAFKEPTYILFCAGLFFSFWSLYFLSYFLTEFTTSRVGLSASTGFVMVMVFNGVGVLGRLPPAYLADRHLGPLNVITPVLLALSIISFAWMAVKDEVGMYVFSVAAGVLTATIFALITSALASLTTDISQVGVRMGMSYTIGSFGALTGPPIGGALIQLLGGRYWGAQLWAGISLVLASLLLVCARVTKTGGKIKVRI